MSGKQVSSRSNGKKTRGATTNGKTRSSSAKTSKSSKSASRAKSSKTVDVSISKGSKRASSSRVTKASSKSLSNKKKTAAKKSVAKKAIAKKTASKKTASKNASSRKSVSKKTTAKKKASSKKSVAKKSTKKLSTSSKRKSSSAKSTTTKRKSASSRKSTKKQVQVSKARGNNSASAKRGAKKNTGVEKAASKSNSTKSRAVKKTADGKNKVTNRIAVTTGAKRPTLNSIIPAPTREVLKPFRDAAKRTKKLQKDRAKIQKKRGDFLAKQGRKGKKYKMDLRLHTPASLGFFSTGGVDPAPAMVRLAGVKGLDIIGVTDYYNAAYVDQIRASAESTKITVLPGFDMRCRVGSCDSITAIALFPSTHCGADITRVLNELGVPKSAYGKPDYLLEPDFKEVIDCIEKHGGILIPSRVDKTPYRRLAIPALVERFGFHAFDLVHRDNPEFFQKNWPSGGFTFFSFSNANALGQIGCRTATVKLCTPGFEGLKALVARRVEQVDAEAEAA